MTITIIGTVTARPEYRDELQAILSRQVAPTRAEGGCINYDFHVDAADDCVFVFYENWRSQGHLDQHMKMPHLVPLLSTWFQYHGYLAPLRCPGIFRR